MVYSEYMEMSDVGRWLCVWYDVSGSYREVARNSGCEGYLRVAERLPINIDWQMVQGPDDVSWTS